MKKDNSCFSCFYFVPIDEEGRCDIYEYPNHGISYCNDWRPKENKRGSL